MADNHTPRPPSPVARGVAVSAAIVAIGQLLSRLMGLVRETVIANAFGASPGLSAFTVVSAVPDMIYQLLLGGMVSAALVPVLSEYAGQADRRELERVASVLLTAAVTLFAAVVVLLELAAPLVAILMGGGFHADLLRLTAQLVRIIVPSLVFFAAWGVTVAVLYARQQFVFPALASAVYNLGIILAATFLGQRLDVKALSLGVVLGALLQLLIVLPGLRGLALAPRLDLRHPALRRIVILYLPVIASLVVANLGIVIDRNLASRAGEQAPSWMRYATFLVQLPLGLVSVAIATAVLPTLARITDDPNHERFRATLASALRLVIVLVLPATVGLLVLGQEGIRLILERGAFTPFDTAHVTRALLFYLPGLPFAAIDQPLVFAFYARKDTVTPVLVAGAGVGAYLLTGPLLAFGLGLGFTGLVIANSVQLATHCIIMWVLLQRRFGSMAGLGMLETATKATVAAGATGLAALAALALGPRLLTSTGVSSRAALFLGATTLAAVVYGLGLAALRVEELSTLVDFARRRLRGLAGDT